MLVKLLKYDFRSLRRYGVPLLIAMLAGTILGMVCLPLVVRVTEVLPTIADDFQMFFALLMMFGVFGIFGAILLIFLSAGLFQIMVCVDFYKSLITDEGYLTFTLPVKKRDIILSKTINGVLWCLIGVAGAIVSVMLVIVSLILFTDVPWPSTESLREFGQLFGYSDTLMLVQFLLYALLGTVSSLLLYFCAIFLGSVIARRNKLIVSIGCILVANFLYSTVLGIVMAIIEFITIGFGVALGLGESSIMFQLIFGVMNVVMIAAILLLYFFLHRMMEKKLNLA